nr:immunoglobulin light chain junction region [Macaca mulatta]
CQQSSCWPHLTF